MARPRKGEEKNATATIGVRMTAELRGGMERLAKAHGRTLTQEVVIALERYVEQQGAKGIGRPRKVAAA